MIVADLLHASTRFLRLRLLLLTMVVSPVLGVHAFQLPTAEELETSVHVEILRNDEIFAGNEQAVNDWIPVLVMITNRSATLDAEYQINFVARGNRYSSRAGKLWECTTEVVVKSNEERSVILAYPTGAGSSEGYQYYLNSASFSFKKNDQPFIISKMPRVEKIDTPISDDDECRQLASLVVSTSAPVRGFTPNLSPDLGKRYGSVSINNGLTKISSRDFPQNREALLGFDYVFVVASDPDDFSAGQRNALREAVRAGVTVVLKPDSRGRGLGWIPGFVAKPQLVEVAGEEEHFLFSLESHGSRFAPGLIQIDDGQGRWLALESSRNDPEILRSIDFQRDPWHLGSAVSRLDRMPLLKGLVQRIDQQHRPTGTLAISFWFGVIYVCLFWPVAGWLLKRAGKLPHMLWLQPAVVAVLFLCIYLLVNFIHGVVPRQTKEVILVRTPEKESAIAFVLETSFSPGGGVEALSEGGNTRPRLPFSVGSLNSSIHYKLQPDGTMVTEIDRKVRSISHEVACDVVDLPPVEGNVGLIHIETNHGIRRRAMEAGLDRLFSDAGDSWITGELFPTAGRMHRTANRNTLATAKATLETRRVRRTIVSSILDEKDQEKLSVTPETPVIIVDCHVFERGEQQ